MTWKCKGICKGEKKGAYSRGDSPYSDLGFCWTCRIWSESEKLRCDCCNSQFRRKPRYTKTRIKNVRYVG